MTPARLTAYCRRFRRLGTSPSSRPLSAAARAGSVLEGRDIGTVVFPDASLKVFLTASPEVRARRRVAETGGDVEEVARSIAERDRLDTTRSDSPLRAAPGSVTVDSSGRTVDDVVAEIVSLFARHETGTDDVRR